MFNADIFFDMIFVRDWHLLRSASFVLITVLIRRRKITNILIFFGSGAESGRKLSK